MFRPCSQKSDSFYTDRRGSTYEVYILSSPTSIFLLLLLICACANGTVQMTFLPVAAHAPDVINCISFLFFSFLFTEKVMEREKVQKNKLGYIKV